MAEPEIETRDVTITRDKFADEHGNVVPASHYGFSEDFPEENGGDRPFRRSEWQDEILTLTHSNMPGLERVL